MKSYQILSIIKWTTLNPSFSLLPERWCWCEGGFKKAWFTKLNLPRHSFWLWLATYTYNAGFGAWFVDYWFVDLECTLTFQVTFTFLVTFRPCFILCCWLISVVSTSVWPHRRQLPGSSVPGILQARTLEWVAISFSNAWKWKVKVKSLSHVRLFWPHGLQPTRLLPPWDFPGKSTGVGCHCLPQLYILNMSKIK